MSSGSACHWLTRLRDLSEFSFNNGNIPSPWDRQTGDWQEISQSALTLCWHSHILLVRRTCTYAQRVHTCTHSRLHLDCVAVTVGPWVCSLSGSAWVKARVHCTMVGALHHSASWLDRPWLWGPSRSCWVHSNCALLRKGFCILIMDYSPTSPVWVDSVDRQTHAAYRHVIVHYNL